MSKFWKWFWGIVLGLVIFASGVFVGTIARYQMGLASPTMMVVTAEGPFGDGPEAGVVRVGPQGVGPSVAVQDFGEVETFGPHSRGRGFGHHDDFGGFGPLMIVGGLIHLALFIGILYGAYWLGRRNARLVLDPSTGSGRRPEPVAPARASRAPAAKPAPRSRTRRG